MNLQIRKLSGNTFTAEDILELQLSSIEGTIVNAAHSIELISGTPVTHGGGAEAGTFLHYKAIIEDLELIDYSNIVMNVVQEAQGTSVIKGVVEITTEANLTEFNSDSDVWTATWLASGIAAEDYTVEEPTLVKIVLKTSEVTLEFSEDTFT
jgi:hypothetical protein